MAFSVKLKNAQNQVTQIHVEVGCPLFILGPNGAGKSSLMLEIYHANAANAVHISAHRKSWISSNESVAPEELRHFKSSLRSWDSTNEARWVDSAQERPRMAISQLVIAENHRSRQIAAAFGPDQFDHAKASAAGPSAFETINRLFHCSNIPISISIKVTIEVDTKDIVAAEKSRLAGLIANLDIAAIIRRYPLRETGVLELISNELGFTNRKQYESAVLTLVQSDEPSLLFVRSLFGELMNDFEAA